MDDRLRETLSAMMDDQADELAVRRVLSHSDQEAVHRQWQRWQHMRDLLHDAPQVVGVDVRAAVSASLTGLDDQKTAGHGRPESRAGETAPAGPVSRHHTRLRWSAVAMIGLGVLLGFGAGTGWNSVGGPHGDTLVPIRAAVPVAGNEVPEVALQGLDRRQWEHLNRYLLEHAQNNSVGSGQGAVGYARVTSVTGAGY